MRIRLVAVLSGTFVLLGAVTSLAKPFVESAPSAPQAQPQPVASVLPPFNDNDGVLPPKGVYQGPMFKLSHDYPATAPVPAMPWRRAIGNGPITTSNAKAYAEAMRRAVTPDMRDLIEHYDRWDAAKRGWYNEPWLATEREPIHGMYVGSSELDPKLFEASGLRKPITTYVLTYYNKTAAPTLNHVWGTTAQTPTMNATSTQFAEGSVIVKAAFVTACPKEWPVMKGTETWPLYFNTNATTGDPTYRRIDASFMQFDIIVKDSKSAPKTGWVFSTLVYDRRLRDAGKSVWDSMVPLGAQWGNDPDVNSTAHPHQKLMENWNNPAAPAYGGETFGWGNRLSGPNDGGKNTIAYDVGPKRVFQYNAQSSSCMGCHSTAQWNTHTHQMDSFLLPTTAKGPNPATIGNAVQYIMAPAPGSKEWDKWFQDRPGNVPMDKGVDNASVATDFDMVLCFKSLKKWVEAQPNPPRNLREYDLNGRPRRQDYNGKILPQQ